MGLQTQFLPFQALEISSFHLLVSFAHSILLRSTSIYLWVLQNKIDILYHYSQILNHMEVFAVQMSYQSIQHFVFNQLVYVQWNYSYPLYHHMQNSILYPIEMYRECQLELAPICRLVDHLYIQRISLWTIFFSILWVWYSCPSSWGIHILWIVLEYAHQIWLSMDKCLCISSLHHF